MISVLTPSYNFSTTLERCIATVLDQNIHDFEHIVVDGGSSDDTLEVLKKYEHVKWISEPDRGQSDAMNKAFSMSSGEIIVYLNADDIIYSCTFTRVLDSFASYHTWLKRYGKANEHNGKIPRDWCLEDWEKKAILDFHDKHPLEGYRRLTFMMLDDDMSECICPGCPATKEEAEKRIANYVHYYNPVRLHSAIGYITPADCLAGLSEDICNERDRKLEAARQLRQEKRIAAKQVA